MLIGARRAATGRRQAFIMTETISFIGLGAMGGGMAANLIRAGYRLIVNDLEPGKVEALLARASVT